MSDTSTPLDLDTLPLTDDERIQLAAWCDEVLALRAVEKQFGGDADAIMDDKVKPLLERLALTTSVAAPAFTLVRSKGRETLKPVLLLQSVFSHKCEHCGEPTRTTVPMSVIEGAKERGKPSWSVRAKGSNSDHNASASTEGTNSER